MALTRWIPALALAVLTLCTGPAVASLSAQYAGYFGRNKVQYADFDFRVLRTENFDVHYYEGEREAAVMAARMAERWYARLSRLMDHEFRDRQPIILYANHTHFEQTNATPNQIDESTGGFTEILKRRIVLPMAGALAETDHVLGHELVHAFQFDMTGQGPSAVGVDIPGAIRLPLWFIEGMAEYLSLGPVDAFTGMWMRDGLRNAEDDFPTIPELNDPKYFPYRYGHALWSYIAGTYGEDVVPRILRAGGRSGNAIGAIQAVLEVPIDTLSARWREAMEEYYAPIADDTDAPDAFGERVVTEAQSGGQMNLGPALSPDGSEVVFLAQSERSLFSVEMYLADARTNEVKRRLTKTALDPHFESLQFINSSGSWHPDGRRFAFAAVTRGQPVVTVLDTDTGDKVREVKLGQLGEVYTPVWSPDGDRVAFSANVNGFLDLFVLDMETEELTRLTEDPYADFQPAWSPDGERLAFATDRFGADLEHLTEFKPYGLAMLDLGSGEIRALPGFSDGKAIDPHFSPDGRSLYFVSDHGGISNIYRLDLEGERLYQVTDLWTGVSGISDLSPALSVASETGSLAFTANHGGPFRFAVFRVDDEETLAGKPSTEFLTEVDPAVLPPRERTSMQIVRLLEDPRLGLADPITFDSDDYDPALTLDFVSQPTLAFGASDYGVFFAGGATLFFSDMLGDRNLTTLLQINSGRGDLIKGTAALAGYEDRGDRWNRALVAGQVPVVTRFLDRQPLVTEGGDSAWVFQDYRFFQIDRQATGILAYPFDRARRAEFSATVRSVDFAAEVQEVGLETVGGGRFLTGRVFFDRERDLPDCAEGDNDPVEGGRLVCAPGSLHLAAASAAYVYDNSIFGGTSPIAGQRLRMEAEPVVGSLNYVNLLGDLRKYLRFRPFTLAGRALHFGRYGGGADDERLSPLFLGYPSIIRGYDYNSFEFNECVIDVADGRCGVLDQLFGTRIAVANAELRLPLLGGIGLIRASGVPPIEVGGFYDTGIAWSGTDGDGLQERSIVRSYGGLVRVNLFGFAIAELDYVNPVDRPNRDWFWQFSLQPGF